MTKQVLWLLGGLVCLCAIHSVAGTLTWKGGSGTWNTIGLDWLDADGHATTWKNGATAVFKGHAGTVTIDGDIYGDISFQTNGYTVAGDTSLAATGTVDVVSALAAQKLPSRSTLVVTHGTTTEPASYEGWQAVLNGGRSSMVRWRWTATLSTFFASVPCSLLSGEVAA